MVTRDLAGHNSCSTKPIKYIVSKIFNKKGSEI